MSEVESAICELLRLVTLAKQIESKNLDDLSLRIGSMSEKMESIDDRVKELKIENKEDHVEIIKQVKETNGRLREAEKSITILESQVSPLKKPGFFELLRDILKSILGR